MTIPYKQTVIPLCDEVDPRAAAIGAVNTVVNRGNSKSLPGMGRLSSLQIFSPRVANLAMRL